MTDERVEQFASRLSELADRAEALMGATACCRRC